MRGRINVRVMGEDQYCLCRGKFDLGNQFEFFRGVSEQVDNCDQVDTVI